jgi:hypothetical protein
MHKKIYLLVVMILAFILSASTVLARQYAGRYSTIFDLNRDQAINLSDVSQVTTWLATDAHQNCYPFYAEKLVATSTNNTDYLASDSWCSSLLGLVMDAVNTQTYNVIADLNTDGKVNLSDISLMSTWYHNDNYGQVCHYQFTKNYNHNDIHWCAATYQGIADTIGEAVGGPDIAIDYMVVSPERLVLNEASEIKIFARNTGTTNITNQAIINNVYKVLGNFTITESILPQVSASDPIEPGEVFNYIYKGKFTKLGNGYISFVYNAQDTDDELNVYNNSATTWVTVYSSGSTSSYVDDLNIVEAKVSNVQETSATVYWKASMGSNGQYRYSQNAGDLVNLPWLTDGVSNDPSVTGNAFASQVNLVGLNANTKYYVQVRKYYQSASGLQYGTERTLQFKTEYSDRGDDNDDDLPSENTNDTKVKVCHVTGNDTKNHTLEISKDALDAHVAHGDKVGSCEVIYYHPADVNSLLTNLKENRNTEEEARLKKLALADAKEFGVNISENNLDLAAIFVSYGIDDSTKNLGSGERRAVLRDYLETTGYADIKWDDLTRLTNGEKPAGRNLAKEQAQVARALKTFEAIYGHKPNFKDVNEDLAWNTLMYRVRFERDLEKEKIGIKKYQEIFSSTPNTPYDWSVVRVLGYIK